MKKISIINIILISILLANNNIKKIDVTNLYKKCKGCHGSDGKIKALNISPIIASQNMDNLILKLKAYKFGKLNNYGMGRLMTTQTENLSIKEIELLAKYISNL
jgi:cytochrome c553